MYKNPVVECKKDKRKNQNSQTNRYKIFHAFVIVKKLDKATFALCTDRFLKAASLAGLPLKENIQHFFQIKLIFLYIQDKNFIEKRERKNDHKRT